MKSWGTFVSGIRRADGTDVGNRRRARQFHGSVGVVYTRMLKAELTWIGRQIPLRPAAQN